jgi:hypothetical protein
MRMSANTVNFIATETSGRGQTYKAKGYIGTKVSPRHGPLSSGPGMDSMY